jgi:pimeloyl-ACP methyl ester carboxylesterase
MPALHVIDQGTGIPVVWVHGFPLSSLIFEQQLEIPHVRHIVPDLPGFGRSPALPVGSIDDYAAAVIEVLDQKGLEHAVIAGVSMGGYVTMSILRRFPGRASALILIDTREGEDSAAGREGRLDQVDRLEREEPRFIVEAMFPRMLTPATISLGDRRGALVRQAMESASKEGCQSALRAMAHRPDSTAELRAFDRPALIVVGDADDITPPSDSERMAGLMKDATLVRIRAAAHLSNVERPDEFNTAVARFLIALP